MRYKKLVRGQLFLLAAIVFLASVLFTLCPTSKVYAKNTVPSGSYSFQQNHNVIKSSNGVGFHGLGYYCLIGNDKAFLSGSGANLSLSKDAAANSGNSITIKASNLKGDLANPYTIPGCSGDSVYYGWITSYPSGTNYVIGLSSFCSNVKALKTLDPQFTGVGGYGGCKATLFKTTSNNHIQKVGDITKIAETDQVTLPTTNNGGNGGGNTGGNNGKQDDLAQSPDCIHNGDPLTYVLCPIFDGVSNAADWLFNTIVEPFLFTTPIGTSSGDPMYAVWSNFRVYGDVFLVLAVLIVVIGQAIGGGLVDAYTAKKMLPRVLVAAILINLSIYIVAFLVDITNIIGRGLGDIMTAPLQASGQWKFSPNGAQVGGIFSVGILGAILGGGAIWLTLKRLFFSDAAKNSTIHTNMNFASVALYAALMVVIPIIISILAVFVTLVVRKGLILFLIVVSPVAFALYCLPNTEKYFKKWWDLLLEALMVYPIIVAIFAIADILSVTILQANGTKYDGKTHGFIASNVQQISAIIIAFFLQFVPLLAIPFAFRFAGSAIGRIYEAATTGGQRVNGLLEGRRNEAKRRFAMEHEEMQESEYKRFQAMRDAGIAQGGVGGFAKRMVGGYGRNRMRYRGGRHIDEVRAERTAEQAKRSGAWTSNGDDTMQRAATVNRSALRAAKSGGARGLAAAGFTEGYDYEVVRDANGNATGEVKLADAAGKMYSISQVEDAQKTFGNSATAYQQNLSYVMGKATQPEEIDRVIKTFGATASSMGITGGAASGLWTGAAYANQGTHRELKHTKLNSKTGQMELDGLSLLKEMTTLDTFTKQKFNRETYESLAEQSLVARQVVDTGQAAGRFKDVAEAQQYLDLAAKEAAHLEMAGSAEVAAEEDGKPIPAPSAGGRQRLVGSSASANTAEGMRNFIAVSKGTAGVYEDHSSDGETLKDKEGVEVKVRGATPRDNLERRTTQRVPARGGDGASATNPNPTGVTLEPRAGGPSRPVPVGYVTPGGGQPLQDRQGNPLVIPDNRPFAGGQTPAQYPQDDSDRFPRTPLTP